MVLRSFLLFQGSRPGPPEADWSFLRLICGGVLPPPHSPPPKGAGELRLPPLIRREKDSGLPPVTAEKTSCPSRYCKLFDAVLTNNGALSLGRKIGIDDFPDPFLHSTSW